MSKSFLRPSEWLLNHSSKDSPHPLKATHAPRAPQRAVRAQPQVMFTHVHVHLSARRVLLVPSFRQKYDWGLVHWPRAQLAREGDEVPACLGVGRSRCADGTRARGGPEPFKRSGQLCSLLESLSVSPAPLPPFRTTLGKRWEELFQLNPSC